MPILKSGQPLRKWRAEIRFTICKRTMCLSIDMGAGLNEMFFFCMLWACLTFWGKCLGPVPWQPSGDQEVTGPDQEMA